MCTRWIITKCVPKRSRVNETLHFLLDHPRRCYTLLFPSHQTWFLLTFVLALTYVQPSPINHAATYAHVQYYRLDFLFNPGYRKRLIFATLCLASGSKWIITGCYYSFGRVHSCPINFVGTGSQVGLFETKHRLCRSLFYQGYVRCNDVYRCL